MALHAPVPATGHAPAAQPTPVRPTLWLAPVAPAHELVWAARHVAWLSASEAARLARLQRPVRRAQLLAGHVLLRRLVGARTGEPAIKVSIASAADGRPVVEAPRGWRASLAHSGEWVAALLDTVDAAAGVDLEQRKAGRDIRAIVRAACDVDAPTSDAAYALWTQREAEYKAGAGAEGVWVATWHDYALAVCARAEPEFAVVDLDSPDAVRTPALTWTRQPRLPAHALPQ